MSIWKQIALTIVVVAVAAVAWVKYFPGAGDMLTRWGIDWLPVATAEVQPAGGQGQRRGPGGGGQGVVVTAPVLQSTINDRLSAIGTGRANQSVVVKPYASGRLTEITAKSGAEIAAGDLVAKLDAETQQIAVDRAAIALRDAQSRLQRMNALRSSNTASAVQVTEAELAVENAALELRDAELALERRSIFSPIAGIVGIIGVEAGNYVGSDSEIATVDDRSSIVIDFWVPERYAPFISVGSPLTATAIARPGEVFDGEVSAVDNRIDQASRTLWVQARIGNDDDRLRAGMSFRVEMRFPGETYPSVDPLAVQWGGDGAFVWTIRDGRAERVKVQIIQRNTDSVLLDAPLTASDTVVTEGLHVVREGAEVRVASRSPAAGVPENSGQITPAPSGS